MFKCRPTHSQAITYQIIVYIQIADRHFSSEILEKFKIELQHSSLAFISAPKKVPNQHSLIGYTQHLPVIGHLCKQCSRAGDTFSTVINLPSCPPGNKSDGADLSPGASTDYIRAQMFHLFKFVFANLLLLCMRARTSFLSILIFLSNNFGIPDK